MLPSSSSLTVSRPSLCLSVCLFVSHGLSVGADGIRWQPRLLHELYRKCLAKNKYSKPQWNNPKAAATKQCDATLVVIVADFHADSLHFTVGKMRNLALKTIEILISFETKSLCQKSVGEWNSYNWIVVSFCTKHLLK